MTGHFFALRGFGCSRPFPPLWVDQAFRPAAAQEHRGLYDFGETNARQLARRFGWRQAFACGYGPTNVLASALEGFSFKDTAGN
jgi:hypothetical protein